MCENWELLQQHFSDASEATMAQSLRKMTKEKISVRLSSKRNSVEFRMFMYHVQRKKKRGKWKQPALIRRLKFKNKHIDKQAQDEGI